MKKIAILFFSLVFSSVVVAQQGFRFESARKKKIVISFQLINNLIVVPVDVNGAKLNFLLDTGVDQTILFSLDDQQVNLNNIEKIKLKGLGGNDAVEGLKSSHNKVSFPGFSDPDHDIYIVLDQNFNFSSSIGIPVNGIIGYHFFKNSLVEINYDKRRIIVYQDNEKIRKKIANQFSGSDLTLEENKPYTMAEVSISGISVPVKLLVDSGSTDAVWLFQGRSAKIHLPENHFKDFLGRGLSGEIYGQRGRVSKFVFHENEFPDALVAFPDSTITSNVALNINRLGSVGSEILKRFTIIFDYLNKKMYLRKGDNFGMPFNYNMSGLEIHHEGMSWVKEKVVLEPVKKYAVYQADMENPTGFSYKFDLKPIFSVSNVRKDSPADLCGIKKGDILVSINGTPCHRYSLQEINSILKSEEGKSVEIEVERNHKTIKFRFRLKSII